VKSSHLALLAGNTGKITAVDNSPERITKASQNFSRFGITNVKLLKADVEKLRMIKTSKVLLDAPCSGLGAIRRKPDIKWNRTEEDITIRYPAIQKQLLSAAAGYVVPGGALVYCTCTTEPEENERVVEEFLNLNKDFALATPELPPSARPLISDDRRYYRTFSHVHGTDCFFGAKLTRSS
jgi:16S rRNA (cytosine967-C5)-methyltransferase